MDCGDCGVIPKGSSSRASWPTTSVTTTTSGPTNALSATKPSSTWVTCPSTSSFTRVGTSQNPAPPPGITPSPTPPFPILFPGEKPFLCDKCGRGFNRVDNLRSHVKTVHQGKAGIKILEPEEGDEVNIVTVASDDMVTLATEALAATAVTQLTGELGDPQASQREFTHEGQLGSHPERTVSSGCAAGRSWSCPEMETYP